MRMKSVDCTLTLNRIEWNKSVVLISLILETGEREEGSKLLTNEEKKAVNF